ncbi:MAG: GatB/YqeY domain-containing protein [Candidatus Saccharibacteria bacterium]|nr:GatB/YqeY domain-containing protein [Candidatus Saccharibacteria bacterium]MCY4010578.1 GatB/YqeY domain-containing protein [Candidatus Saccharibacteria bacterium]
MSVFAQLEMELKQALLDRQAATVEVLKLLKSDILLAVKQTNQTRPTDKLCRDFIYKHLKNYQEALVFYKQNGHISKAEAKQLDIEILNRLLPPQLTDTEIENVVNNYLNKTNHEIIMSNFKILLEELMIETDGQASQSQIAQKLKVKLSTNV